jgi:hypothetical protein
MPTDAFLSLPTPELLSQVGQGLKRVSGANEQPDARGYRTVWHHGTMKTDLFTHLSPDGEMVRQELVFLGQVVAWDHRGGLSTGRGGESASAATPAAQTLDIDDGGPVDRRTLANASLLLREVPDADVYVLHLRKIINEALNRMGDPHSLIRDIEPELRQELQRLYDAANPDAALAAAMLAAPPREPPRSRRTLLFVIGLAVGMAVVGLWALIS